MINVLGVEMITQKEVGELIGIKSKSTICPSRFLTLIIFKPLLYNKTKTQKTGVLSNRIIPNSKKFCI